MNRSLSKRVWLYEMAIILLLLISAALFSEVLGLRQEKSSLEAKVAEKERSLTNHQQYIALTDPILDNLLAQRDLMNQMVDSSKILDNCFNNFCVDKFLATWNRLAQDRQKLELELTPLFKSLKDSEPH